MARNSASTPQKQPAAKVAVSTVVCCATPPPHRPYISI
jgi:hypothetical protein